MSIYSASQEASTPAAPAAGRDILYPKADGFYIQDSAGAEKKLVHLESGLIPANQIPPLALERMVVVADQAARYALTTASVQNGDTVKQTDTGEMWFVIDEANLGNSAGYSVYTAGTASAVALSGITGAGTGVLGALAVALGGAGAVEVNSNKNASGGYAGLSGFALQLKNAANTFTNLLSNATTAARAWAMPDKDGTVAMTNDKLSAFAATTSAELADVLSDKTGSGAAVFAASPVLTTPQINDTSADHQYIVAVSELTADRTVTFPLLTGNDEFVFKDHAQALTNKTLVGALATATLADGTNNLALADAQYVNSQINLHTDQKQTAMGIDLTSSASVRTLSATSNNNLNVGTYDFTLVWTGSLPDWTPSANVVLIRKGSSGYELDVLSTGVIRAILNGVSYASTVGVALPDGGTATISAIVTRESASVAGSIVFKVGEYTLGDPVEIAAGAPATLSSANIMYVSGASASRYASRNHAVRIFNRALTDAEWSRFVRTGVDFADIGASQATLNVSSMANGTFDSSSGLSATGGTFTKSTADTKSCGTADEIAIEVGKNYLVTFNASLTGDLTTASVFLRNSVSVGTVSNVVALVSGANVMLLTAIGATTGVVGFSVSDAQGTAGDLVISDLRVVRAGAIANYEPSGIQPNQWHDSANDNHLEFPASGASLSQWKEAGQYNWTVAITGDTTLTSIVPAGYELDKLVFKNSTAGAVSVRLGTTAGGTEIFGLTALNTSATFGGFKTISVGQGFSLTTAQTLYLSSTDWTGGGTAPSLTFTMYFRRIS